jgi:mono/diheme cytochrome c family protein
MSGMVVRSLTGALICASIVIGRTALPLAHVTQTPAAPAAENAVTYTEEQAGRGAEVFSGVCVECHARKDFSDEQFRGKWRGRTAFDLFERIRSTMPESNPGSLERSSYLDVVAYIVKLNTLPAGSVAMPDDEAALKKQTLTFPSDDR